LNVWRGVKREISHTSEKFPVCRNVSEQSGTVAPSNQLVEIPAGRKPDIARLRIAVLKREAGNSGDRNGRGNRNPLNWKLMEVR